MLHLPVIKSVMAKLKTSVLYGILNRDLFLKITASKIPLLMMANEAIAPNTTLRLVDIVKSFD